MLDLDAIAEEEANNARNARRGCWGCSLPEDVQAWIVKANAEGRQWTVMVKTLKRAGHKDATYAKLKNHLERHASE